MCVCDVCVRVQTVAHVEAVIDFGEDENIEDTVMEEGIPYNRKACTPLTTSCLILVSCPKPFSEVVSFPIKLSDLNSPCVQ